MKYGLPSRAGMPITGASIWARKEPQLLPRSKSGCSRSMMERISFSASFGCKGRSGVSTTAVPSNASFKALAIGQLPVAKNPCRNNIFFMLILYCLYLYVVNWMDAGLNSCFIPFSLLPNDHYSHCQHTQYEAFLQYDA